MKRSVWKWLFGISLALLVLLILFTFTIWLLANVGGVLFIMLAMGSEDIHVGGITLEKFLENFVDSPIFYIYLADLAVLLSSIVALIMTRKQKVKNLPAT